VKRLLVVWLILLAAVAVMGQDFRNSLPVVKSGDGSAADTIALGWPDTTQFMTAAGVAITRIVRQSYGGFTIFCDSAYQFKRKWTNGEADGSWIAVNGGRSFTNVGKVDTIFFRLLTDTVDCYPWDF